MLTLCKFRKEILDHRSPLFDQNSGKKVRPHFSSWPNIFPYDINEATQFEVAVTDVLCFVLRLRLNTFYIVKLF